MLLHRLIQRAVITTLLGFADFVVNFSLGNAGRGVASHRAGCSAANLAA